MKAIVLHKYGGPEVLNYEDVDTPHPAADELLIKVYASSVNPVEYKIREGKAKAMFPIKFPHILGTDVSGEIEEVGSDIKNFRKGDEVYSNTDIIKNGTYAEYVLVKANLVNKKPQTISHEKVATVPLAGLTAWQGLFDHGNLERGERVLIHGATGGVGSFAVQFAKWKGAYVIGTASKDSLDFLEELGADEVIDYKNEKFEEEVKDIDLVFDLIGGETQKRSLKVIKKGGRLITTVQPSEQEEAKLKNINLQGFMTKTYPGELQKIAGLIDSGKVKPVIFKTFALKDIISAHKLLEEGHVKGKIVLQVA